jgi:chromate transporter
MGEVFLTFLKLGLTSFGGPIAHLGYFHREIVMRRGWLSDDGYAELVGLGQFLPGPASSQVGFAIGLVRAGWWGGVAAWVAFTLPSALAMLLFAYVADRLVGPLAAHAIHGLKLVAVPIVAQALLDMARKVAPDLQRRFLAMGAAVFMLAVAVPAMQILVILLGGLTGTWLCREGADISEALDGWRPTRRDGIACLIAFAVLFAGLPIAASALDAPVIGLVDIFYRAGSLVFGGGHVVLPLLRAGLVPNWMTDAQFLAGYGAAQALPGPLFTLGAYLGAVAMPQMSLAAGLLAALALSLPGLLLMAGAIPFQAALRRNANARGAVAGVNAVVVGLLAAALYNPLWTTGVTGIADMAIVAVDLALLVLGRWPPLAIVLLTVAASVLRPLIG